MIRSIRCAAAMDKANASDDTVLPPPVGTVKVNSRLSARRLAKSLRQVSKHSPPNRTYTSRRIRLSTYEISLIFQRAVLHGMTHTAPTFFVCGQS